MASTYKNRNSWARALLGTWFVIGGCATGGSFWGGEDISLLPRQSQDADQVITLQSNMNCQFFVDSQPLAKGKRVRIVVTRGSHQLVCKPDEYRAKEEYVQPPYDSYHPIGFTFLMEDKLQSVEKLEVEENRPPSDQRGVQVSSKVPMDYLPGANGKAWAVVIGIDEYKHAPRLKYAVADAKAVADMLGRQGFQVAALYNEQATRDAIERELGDRLVTRVGEQDRESSLCPPCFSYMERDCRKSRVKVKP